MIAARRLPLCAIALSLWVTWSVPGLAQSSTQPQPAAETMNASLSHSAYKALTLKAISVTSSFFIFAAGTGSAATGGLMAVTNGIASYVIVVGNDYGWDTFWPNTNLKSNQQSFGTFSSLSRNTLKYLTLKPMLTVLNVGIVYAFTDTLAATVGTSTAVIMLLPASFYLNNTLWDWYDWSHPPTQPPPPAK